MTENPKVSKPSGNGGHGILSEGPCISTTGAPITSLDQCDPASRVARDANHCTGLKELLQQMIQVLSFLTHILSLEQQPGRLITDPESILLFGPLCHRLITTMRMWRLMMAVTMRSQTSSHSPTTRLRKSLITIQRV